MMLPHGFFLQEHNLVFFHRGSGIQEGSLSSNINKDAEVQGIHIGQMAIYLVGSAQYPFHVKIHPHVVFEGTQSVYECLRPIFEETDRPGSGSVSSVVSTVRLTSLWATAFSVSSLQKTGLCVQPSTDHACDADISGERWGSGSASFFLLSRVVDFPGFLQAGPD